MLTIFIKNHNLLILIFFVKKQTCSVSKEYAFSGPIRSASELFNMQKESIEYVFCRYYQYLYIQMHRNCPKYIILSYIHHSCKKKTVK